MCDYEAASFMSCRRRITHWSTQWALANAFGSAQSSCYRLPLGVYGQHGLVHAPDIIRPVHAVASVHALSQLLHLFVLRGQLGTQELYLGLRVSFEITDAVLERPQLLPH